MTLDLTRLNSLHANNEINDYMYNFILKSSESGYDQQMLDEALDDAITVSKLHISSDEEYRTFFYIDQFTEDLIGEIFGIKLSEEEEEELKIFLFNSSKDIVLNDLLSYRVLVLKWLKGKGKLSKDANRFTRLRNEAPLYLDKYNLERWGELVKSINKAILAGLSTNVAIKYASDSILDHIEKLNFLAWYNFRFGNLKDLYNVNKKIKQKSAKMTKKVKTASIYEDALNYYVPKEVFKSEEPGQVYEANTQQNVVHDFLKQTDTETLEDARSKMVARTFAIDKLLEKYRQVLNEQQVDDIENALNTLRKQIRKLKSAQTITDFMIKTANILEKSGFEDGSITLKKIASNDQKLVKNALVQPDSADSLSDLLDELTLISTFLKQREIVRHLAQADLALYNLNIASLFPELTEAQSKLIDAFSYASNKIDDIIPKIRGAVGNLRSNVNQENLKIPLSFPDKEDVSVEEPPKKPVVNKPKQPKPLAEKVEEDKGIEIEEDFSDVADLEINEQDIDNAVSKTKKDVGQPLAPKLPTPPKPKVAPKKIHELKQLEKAVFED